VKYRTVHFSRRSRRDVSGTEASRGDATSSAEAPPVHLQLSDAPTTPAHVYETVDQSSLGNAQQQRPPMTSSNATDLYEREGQVQGHQNTGCNDYECTLVENDLYR